MNRRNVLDSSAPTKCRGKERELPKPKRTTVRKAILRQTGKEESKDIENEVTVEDEIAEKMRNLEVDVITREQRVEKALANILHHANYREYCSQSITDDINKMATILLGELVRFQDRSHQENPVKAKTRRRMGFGMKEVSKYVDIGKVKCLIVAPNVMQVNVLDKMVNSLIEKCNVNNTPVIFALSRKKLAKVCKKTMNVSCVAIFSYDGAQDKYKELMQLVEEAKRDYKEVSDAVRYVLEMMEDSEFEFLEEQLKNHCNVPQFEEFVNKLNVAKQNQTPIQNHNRKHKK